MSVRFTPWIGLVFITTVGCGGKEDVAGKADGGASPTPAQSGASMATAEGSCSFSGTGWSCTSPTADAPRILMPCSAAPDLGGACSVDTSVDTTNPQLPTHTVTYPECFACTSNGMGTDWTCGASGWESAGTFLCR